MQFKKKLVFETEYWRVGLAEEQTYLGYCVVALKRQGCGDLAELTREEILDFLDLVRKFEKALRETFHVTMFNWSCLMNNAYQLTPAKPHVHWHVKPRYDHKVELMGEVFQDPNFGHHYILLEDLHRMASDEMQEEIIAKIQESLPLQLG
ncbi:MAG TPA: HIT family protein [Candidatus Paceibacterota bacterium]|uniref:HIT domain-containing protein n=1 Tax=Candidatus Zambryskibacteria bacterium RIFCSPLOWO2_01_FULL_45_43 TaxID=1802762 RepID=A0A1G2U8M9_9BACT|nr:MAG: hypothetical protein A3B16_02575 [Candidatus Zambryskibacteria bacterium RIFCSPLOWO2_01_FULL_45_43]